MNKLTFGSLFAGIGGFDLGFERAGMQCKWQVEIDEYCNQILEKHWPNVRRWGDVRTWPQPDAERVDVICGGFPCQDVSAAGGRAGIGGERSGLYLDMLRSIRDLRPSYAVLENVAGLRTDGLATVLRDLDEIGYDAEWERQAMDSGHDPEIARAVAFWQFEPTQTLLIQLIESAHDEHEPLILSWAKHHHAVFESISRARRKQLEKDFHAFIGKPSKYHKRWLSAYYKTQYWSDTKQQAELRWESPGKCAMCPRPRDDWHHSTYDHIGTLEDAKYIIPVCDGCHKAAHISNRNLSAGPMPDSVRRILQSESV